MVLFLEGLTFSRQLSRLFYYFLLRKKSLIFVVHMYYRPGPLVQAYYCYEIVKLPESGPARLYRWLPPRYNLGVRKQLQP